MILTSTLAISYVFYAVSDAHSFSYIITVKFFLFCELVSFTRKIVISPCKCIVTLVELACILLI